MCVLLLLYRPNEQKKQTKHEQRMPIYFWVPLLFVLSVLVRKEEIFSGTLLFDDTKEASGGFIIKRNGPSSFLCGRMECYHY